MGSIHCNPQRTIFGGFGPASHCGFCWQAFFKAKLKKNIRLMRLFKAIFEGVLRHFFRHCFPRVVQRAVPGLTGVQNQTKVETPGFQ